MKKFRFRLDRLLRLRRAEYRQKTAELAQAHRQRNACQADLDEAEDGQHEMQIAYRRSASSRTMAVSLAGAQSAVIAARRLIFERTRILSSAQQAAEKARYNLLITLRELETLERFRNRRLDEHNSEEQRNEQTQFDETATLRYQLQSLVQEESTEVTHGKTYPVERK